MGRNATMVSLRLLLVHESQRGYSPFSNTYCSPLQLACSYPTHLRRQKTTTTTTTNGAVIDAGAQLERWLVVCLSHIKFDCFSLFHSLFFWSFASFLCLSLTHTHGPHSTSMEPTFSTPASWRLLQGPVSSWQRPWKFSCS